MPVTLGARGTKARVQLRQSAEPTPPITSAKQAGVEKLAPEAEPAAVFCGEGKGVAPSSGESPAGLVGEARATHVRQSLLTDNASVRADNPEGWEAKLDKLVESPFTFFRGTAGLFYRDLIGVDVDGPKGLINGDVHPENFGIMQAGDGQLVFGLNDFDEATRAPFMWDVRRGVVGFELAARGQGLSKKDRRKVTEAFVEAYADALKAFGKNDAEASARLTKKNANEVLVDLFKDAEDQSRKAFLKERVDLDAGQFLTTDEINPCPERGPVLMRALRAARNEDGEKVFGKDFPMPAIKDVAEKLGSGTGSVGLDRFYVLLAGGKPDGTDDRIIELKRARPSIIEQVLPRRAHQLRGVPSHRPRGRPRRPGSAAERIARAHDVQLSAGDPTYGATRLGGESFLVRERNPHKARVDLDKLSPKELKAYAAACGEALAMAHARADADGGIGHGRSAEEAIRSSFKKGALVERMIDVAKDTADRVEADHEALVQMRQTDAL